MSRPRIPLFGRVLARWWVSSSAPKAHEHYWSHVNAYEPEKGIDPQWGRKRVKCEGCGEQRLVYRFLALDAIW